MHGSCKSVSDGERYIIILLVGSLLLRGEAVAHGRLLYVVPMTTHINLHSSSITQALDVPIQFCSNCTLRFHPTLCTVSAPMYFIVFIMKPPPALELFLRGAYIRHYTVHPPKTKHQRIQPEYKCAISPQGLYNPLMFDICPVDTFDL